MMPAGRRSLLLPLVCMGLPWQEAAVLLSKYSEIGGQPVKDTAAMEGIKQNRHRAEPGADKGNLYNNFT